MMFSDFETCVHGKWILAGEHAVLRGKPAIVFPFFMKKLHLRYETNEHNLTFTATGIPSFQLESLFWNVVNQAATNLEIPLNQLKGHFLLSNDIPLGVGLGFSAALCVAVTRWFIHQQLLDPAQFFNFAKNLEHIFHRESSGLDIVGVSSTQPTLFQQGKTQAIQLAWQPKFVLTYSDAIAITSNAVSKVKQFWQIKSQQAAKIDETMAESVNEAVQALENPKPHALHQLMKAMEKAASCFNAWGLMTDHLIHYHNQLKEAGALAAKPTGSGNGGYILSLWQARPPAPYEIIQ